MSSARDIKQRQMVLREIPELGAVLFMPSKRARRMRISIRPFCPVQVVYPWNTTKSEIVAFLQKHRDWTEKHLARVRQIEAFQCRQSTSSAFSGSETDAVQWLCSRIQMLADRHGFKFSRVSIRRQRTRWGSCSPKNNISLNIELTGLSAELCDYVLLHELVHTKVKNHSKQFWQCLDNCCAGQARELDKELKRYYPRCR